MHIQVSKDKHREFLLLIFLIEQFLSPVEVILLFSHGFPFSFLEIIDKQ